MSCPVSYVVSFVLRFTIRRSEAEDLGGTGPDPTSGPPASRVLDLIRLPSSVRGMWYTTPSLPKV